MVHRQIMSVPFYASLNVRFLQVGSICFGPVDLMGAECEHALSTTASVRSYGLLSSNVLYNGAYANQDYRHVQQERQHPDDESHRGQVHDESQDQQHMQLLQQQEQYTLLQQRMLLQKLKRVLAEGDGVGQQKHENTDIHNSRSQPKSVRSEGVYMQDQEQALLVMQDQNQKRRREERSRAPRLDTAVAEQGESRHMKEKRNELVELASGGGFVLICTCFNTAATHERRTKAGLVNGAEDGCNAAQLADVGFSVSPDDQGFLRIAHIKQASSASQAAMMGEMVRK
jgi:hypothetical protein